jgi:hypothetical protein
MDELSEIDYDDANHEITEEKQLIKKSKEKKGRLYEETVAKSIKKLADDQEAA